MSELRWHPLLGQWVATATHRQERTFFPPPGHCPLCPSLPGGTPTEIPAASYDIVVFDNKFPALHRHAPEPAIPSSALVPVVPARGACEVVVYAPDHDATLADAPVRRIEHLVRVWRDRTRRLSARDDVAHVFPFENKGAEIGVTLTHPHGQIYAYPFVPPVVAAEIARHRAHRDATGRCLLCDVREAATADGTYLLAREPGWDAVVPPFARYPYETYAIATRCVRSLLDLDAVEIAGLARLLKRVLVGFDRLFAAPFPYVMAVHQAPARGDDPYHLHVEFYPPLRAAGRLKYLAGSESGAGMFINDTLPEETAARLRAVVPARV